MSWQDWIQSKPGMIICSLFGAMILGSAVRWFALRNADPDVRRKRLSSLATWWTLALLLALGIATGTTVITILVAVASLIGISEFHRLISQELKESGSGQKPESSSGDAGRHRSGFDWTLVIVVIWALTYYGLLLLGSSMASLSACLFIGISVMAIARMLAGSTHGYLLWMGAIVWGFLFLVVGLSHAAMVLQISYPGESETIGVEWFVYLIVLTEFSDISQALIGRRFGHHKKRPIAPRISPNKTWEGTLGGLICTVALSIILANFLVSYQADGGQTSSFDLYSNILLPAVAGASIMVVGFAGDLNMSSVKRDVGVKDSSRLLPGMGGMLDRIDSLSFTAPVFFYLLHVLLVANPS